MNDKNLDRFAPSRKFESHLGEVAGPSETETHDLGYFGVLRGTSERSVMLELRKRDGNIMAIGYAWLERVEFDPSVGISLFAAGWEITVAGRNLKREVRPNLRIFEALTRHRVPWLREGGESELLQAPPEATIIEEIRWKSIRR